MYLCLAVCVACGIVVFARAPGYIRLIICQLLLAGICETLGEWQKPLSTGWLYNIYMVLEFSLLIASAYDFFQTKFYKRAAIAALFLYLPGWIYQIASNGIDYFSVMGYVLGCIYLTPVFLAAVYEISIKTENPRKHPFLWQSIGIIIYFGGVIPIFSMFNYFIHGNDHSKELGIKLYAVNDILGVLRYGLIFYGLLLIPRKNVIK